jgi:hypothetical protein
MLYEESQGDEEHDCQGKSITILIIISNKKQRV